MRPKRVMAESGYFPAEVGIRAFLRAASFHDLSVSSNEAEVRHQIRQTLIHELGHYFGMTEEQLKDV